MLVEGTGGILGVTDHHGGYSFHDVQQILGTGSQISDMEHESQAPIHCDFMNLCVEGYRDYESKRATCNPSDFSMLQEMT